MPEADLRALVEQYVNKCDVCDGCILNKDDSCPVWSRVMPDDISWSDCRDALHARFVLSAEPKEACHD